MTPAHSTGAISTKYGVGRQVAHVVGVAQRVFGKAAVDRVAGVLLALAQRLPAAQAVRAMAAGRVQPRNADAVALLDMVDTGAHCGDIGPRPSWPGMKGGWFDRPVALGGVQVGVADAAGPRS